MQTNTTDKRSVLPRATTDFAFTDLSAPRGLSRDETRRFQRQQISAVARNAPYMMAANMLAAIWLVWASWGSPITRGVSIWAAIMLVLSGSMLLRTLMRRRRRHHSPAEPARPRKLVDYRRIIRRAEFFACVMGLVWAALPALYMPASSPDLQLLIMGSVMGASGMGAFSLSRIPTAALIYASLLSGALAMACVNAGGPASIAAFGLAAIYGIGLAAMIISAHRTAISRAEDWHELDRQGEIIKLLLRDFQASVSDWLWETDASGRLVYASDRLATVAGRCPERLLGARFDQLAGTQGNAPEWAAFATRMQRLETMAEIELPVDIADNRAWWQLSARPLFDDMGSFIGYRGVGRDVTARHEAELALVNAKEAAERAGAAKSQFLAVMSHELRTPLNAISGFADLLSQYFRDKDCSSERREYADSICVSASHLSSLINDILDVTRMERGDIQLVEQELDPQELSEIVVRMCRGGAEPKSISLIESYPDKTYEVRGDLTRLKQILINLVTNAIKFTPEAGRIDIAIAEPAGGGIEFTISDNGMGIKPSQIEEIFQPFVQADQSHERRFGGVGLGLSIARQLARLHEGDVTIESMPGLGTTARLRLPAHRVREFSAAAHHVHRAAAALG